MDDDTTQQAGRPDPVANRPLAGYGMLMATFAGLTGGFAAWMTATGRELPERVDTRDLVLIAVATHKTSRLVTRDKVTAALRAPFTTFQDDEAGPAEVNETARGTGLRRAIGELLICPYCIGMWLTTAFLAGLAVAPRPTRWIASAFATLAAADVLHIGYVKAEQTL